MGVALGEAGVFGRIEPGVHAGEDGKLPGRWEGELPLPPARQFAILTCMDTRLDPAKYAGLAEGDAHVIRNAGGRATDDAVRSLVISHKLLGTREWFVIHYTNCGMELFAERAGEKRGVRVGERLERLTPVARIFHSWV